MSEHCLPPDATQSTPISVIYTLHRAEMAYTCGQCGQRLTLAVQLVKINTGESGVVQWTLGCRCDLQTVNLAPYGVLIPVETLPERTVHYSPLTYPDRDENESREGEDDEDFEDDDDE